MVAAVVTISVPVAGQEPTVPPPAPVAAPSATPPETAGPSAEEIAELEATRKSDIDLLAHRTQEFREVVDGMVERVYRMRLTHIEDTYEGQIRAEEELVSTARRTAIEYFEAFLRKYPNSPPYTPDAMYRLAELYYDESYVTYMERVNVYAIAQEKKETNGAEPPAKEYDRTINLFKSLVQRYPQYRNVDGAYYLLGYCLNETGREKEARLAWLNLVCGNKYSYDPEAIARLEAETAAKEEPRPAEMLETGAKVAVVEPFVDPYTGCKPITENSRFFFEAWYLIGNYHFDYDISRYGVETAIAAYKKLVTDPNHRFYDRGLYKLGWSYYKANQYPDAIQMFSQLVDFSDKRVAGARGGEGMRPEAIQYLAVSFFEEDWDGDLKPDAVTGIQRLQDPALMPQERAWTREVYERLGQIYFENEKNELAIQVWQLYLQKWPLDVRAPFVQEKIAEAYNKMRQFNEEIVARSKLDSYASGSEWWNANQDHPSEQNEVALMVRDAMIGAALFHHQTARNLRQRGIAAQDPDLLQRANDEYNLAASAYRKFLEQNPDTPDAYEYNYNLADALFWSGQYEAAKVEYASTRDSNLDNRYKADAARMVMACLDKIVEKQIADGTLVMRTEPPPLEGQPPMPNPEPLPPIVLEQMNERDEFIKSAPDHPDAAKYKYQSAQNYYRYGHWDEAKKRFEELYGLYCMSDPVGLIAWQTLFNMATAQNSLDERERLALLQQQKQCKVAGAPETDQGIPLDEVLGDVAMQRAMTKFKECSEGKDATVCTDAGNQLLAAVGKAPKHQSADAALHNAALAFENAQRFETAMDIYGRIINEYPQSQWVAKCIFKQAFAANNFFEYEKALSNYKILADEPRFKDSEYKVDAVLNSAILLTNLQSYTEAASYWERYSREVEDPKLKIEASFKAADMQYRAKKWVKAVASYNSFIKTYGQTKDAGSLVVKASYNIGLCQHEMRKPVEEVKNWARTVDLYRQLVNEPRSMSAEYAAESQFLIVEQDMRKFEGFAIKGSMKVIEAQMKEGAAQVKEFETRYKQVQEFERPVWSLAAEFRIGWAYEIYAKAILAIPPPPLDKDQQKLLKQLPPEDREQVIQAVNDKFQAAKEQWVAPMEERAKAEYKIAVELAKKGNISNEWTLQALARMNAYDPDGYPRRHNGLVETGQDTLAAPAWAPEVQ
jgi:cellulose synthase operon protein C